MKTNKNTHENHKNKKPKTKKTTVLFSILTIATIIIAGFFLTSYAARETEKPIVVIIASYNNIKWYEKNLSMIKTQKYKNWRAIYIDDCSKDGTGEAVAKYIADHNLGSKITLIKNPENKGAMYNTYAAVQMCKDNEVCVICDGDDWLYDDMVFSTVNKTYQAKNGKVDTWMTYGQFTVHPTGQIGYCRQIPDFVTEQNAFRNYTWLSSHLRTFYAGLFKKIKTEDFMFEGKFLPTTCDMAEVFPMLEMAGEHATFIPKIMYVYNHTNPLCDFNTRLELQLYLERVIRGKPKYERLSSLK